MQRSDKVIRDAAITPHRSAGPAGSGRGLGNTPGFMTRLI
jgi:hypothetical protein